MKVGYINSFRPLTDFLNGIFSFSKGSRIIIRIYCAVYILSAVVTVSNTLILFDTISSQQSDWITS